MSEIQQNRYDQLLRRVADLKGPGSKVNDALGELFPMFDVENVPAELLLLAGTRLCIGTVFQTAGGAGLFSTAILRNNLGTGVIARLIEIHVIFAGADAVFGPTLNSDTASGSAAFTDTRVFGEGTALVTQGNNNLAVVGSTFWVGGMSADNNYVWTPPPAIGVIAPGSGFQVTGNLANTAIRVNFMWLERVAQPSELNL